MVLPGCPLFGGTDVGQYADSGTLGERSRDGPAGYGDASLGKHTTKRARSRLSQRNRVTLFVNVTLRPHSKMQRARVKAETRRGIR
jgi:hypothetical protein